MKLLLDEMYPASLAEALRGEYVEVSTAAELGLAGRSDYDLCALARADGWVVLTENVADFARISAEHLTGGGHHPGILIALSSRFSRRPGAHKPLIQSILGVAGEDLNDRVVYLRAPEP